MLLTKGSCLVKLHFHRILAIFSEFIWTDAEFQWCEGSDLHNGRKFQSYCWSQYKNRKRVTQYSMDSFSLEEMLIANKYCCWENLNLLDCIFESSVFFYDFYILQHRLILDFMVLFTKVNLKVLQKYLTVSIIKGTFVKCCLPVSPFPSILSQYQHSHE